jgi:hypothetical protein
MGHYHNYSHLFNQHQYGAKHSSNNSINRNKETHATSMRKIPIPCRAVDSTLLFPISAIVSQLAAPTEDTLKQTNQLLNHLATQSYVSGMTLAVHAKQPQ